MGLIKEFKEFIIKGNAIDLAVGIILGAAFGRWYRPWCRCVDATDWSIDGRR